MSTARGRHEVVRHLFRARIVPLFYAEDSEVARRVLDACAAGGALVVEFTLRGPRALMTFGHLVAHAQAAWSDLLLGAGTVWDAPTAAAAIEAGAAFVVSPVFDPAVAQVCHRRGVLYIPGAATPTEVARAAAAGAGVVKLFPAAPLGGPAYLKAIRAVMPDVPLMPI